MEYELSGERFKIYNNGNQIEISFVFEDKLPIETRKQRYTCNFASIGSKISGGLHEKRPFIDNKVHVFGQTRISIIHPLAKLANRQL